MVLLLTPPVYLSVEHLLEIYYLSVHRSFAADSTGVAPRDILTRLMKIIAASTTHVLSSRWRRGTKKSVKINEVGVATLFIDLHLLCIYIMIAIVLFLYN